MSVMTVHDGEQAHQFLETQDMLPAVIVCDLHMPKKNGFEFVQAIKQDERFRDIPVISLTSDKDVEAEISLLKLGVAAFISKSEDPRILALHVMRHVVIDDSKKAA
jgi:CheY-like chemotaxis protein